MRSCVGNGGDGGGLGEGQQNVQLRGQRSENVETWNVGASHVDDGGDQSLLRLGILRFALLKLAGQPAEVATPIMKRPSGNVEPSRVK